MVPLKDAIAVVEGARLHAIGSAGQVQLADQPAVVAASASNLVTSGAASDQHSLPFVQPWTELGYMPVRKLARVGVQMGLWQ